SRLRHGHLARCARDRAAQRRPLRAAPSRAGRAAARVAARAAARRARRGRGVESAVHRARRSGVVAAERARLGAGRRPLRRRRRDGADGATRAPGGRRAGARRPAGDRGRRAACRSRRRVGEPRAPLRGGTGGARSHRTRALRARPTTSEGNGMIEDRAKDLGRLIGQSTEYKDVKRASDALNEDKDTVALLQRMEQLRVDAQRMLSRGERPTEEMERELDGLLGQIQGRATYQRLLVAQENFDKTMARVNDWILEGIDKGAASPIITLG